MIRFDYRDATPDEQANYDMRAMFKTEELDKVAFHPDADRYSRLFVIQVFFGDGPRFDAESGELHAPEGEGMYGVFVARSDTSLLLNTCNTFREANAAALRMGAALYLNELKRSKQIEET